MDKNKMNLELVKNAVVALEAQKGFYVEAVKSHEVKDLDEILKHRGQHEGWFDDKKTIRTDLLVEDGPILEPQLNQLLMIMQCGWRLESVLFVQRVRI